LTVFCGGCIRESRNRGEKIYVGHLVHSEEFDSCMWCEEPDDELYAVEFDRDLERDDEFEGYDEEI